MDQISSEKYSFDGKEYDIRVFRSETEIIVKAFFDNQPLGECDEAMTRNAQDDSLAYHGKSLIEDLIQQVETCLKNLPTKKE